MPYRMTWIVPKHVLLTTFSGLVTQEELQQFIIDIRNQLHQGTPPLYHISNSLAMEKVGMSLKALTGLVKSVRLFATLELQIDINHRGGINTFFAALAPQMVGIDARTVTSLDDAIALLKKVNPTLADMTWELPAQTSAGIRPDAAGEEQG